MFVLVLVVILLSQALPIDGGQMYAETDFDRFIVEPWNAASSLFILMPAIYWAVKLRGRYKEYPFITFCIPLLFLGGLGSTLFHAFRNSPYLLLLDITPTAILTVALAIYFWIKVLPKWWIALIIIVVSISIRYLAFHYMERPDAVNVSYAISGTVLFIPTLILLYQTRLAASIYIFISLACFILSFVFRQVDKIEQSLFPMGTHFLWHILTGIGAFFLAEYLYKLHLQNKDVKVTD